MMGASGFQNFCIKNRWWFIIGGFLLMGIGGIGLIIMFFGVLGFIWKHKKFRVNENYIPKMISIILLFKFKNKLTKCPVCKSKLKKTNEGFICSKCESELETIKEEGDGSPVTLKLKITNREYDSKYNHETLFYYDWYYISEKGKPTKKYLIDSAEKDILVNMSGCEKVNETVASSYGIILSKNENLYFFEENVNLEEPRSVRKHGGGTVRVAKGFYVHLGQSKSHDELTRIATGNIAFTNKRILFRGDLKSYEIPLKKVIGITEYSNCIKISNSKRTKPQYFYLPTPDLANAILKGLVNKMN